MSPQVLSNAQDQLNEAQIAIQERAFMAESHQRAEHALAAHALRLTGELGACAGDLSALFGKFEQVAALQKGDR